MSTASSDVLPDAPPPAGLRPGRRSAVLALAALTLVVLTAVAAVLPVPYVLEAPGPTTNTLGSQNGKPLISISGRQTYPTQGALDLVTVLVRGTPSHTLGLLDALKGWLDPHDAVVPEEEIYPPGQTTQEVQQENAKDMSDSQRNASVAALRALGIPVPVTVTVAQVEKGGPSDGALQTGDVVTRVDGTAVTSSDQLRRLVTEHRPGDTVPLVVRRDGTERTVKVTLGSSSDGGPKRAVIGVLPKDSYDLPFTVDISLDDVGGPSAGMMFALGIIDKLTPGALNGGKHVAGTGTIDPAGTVGPIGGIPQKMVGARDAGAVLFLAPAENCREAVANKPDGLQLAKVSTIQDALHALELFRDGKAAQIPGC
ncbi:MAG TPA: PDZ domain-containing protein [Motilibacteraceae bacterium]|nr:PDZ domain-containing protein [Motilibacteraceae bacterium]